MQTYTFVFYWDLARVSSSDGLLNSSYWRCKSRCFFFFLKLSCFCCCCCLVAQLCLTLCNPMDCCPPGSSLHGISQARILEWVAISFSRGSSQPRNQTPISCIGGQILHHGATRYAPQSWELHFIPGPYRARVTATLVPLRKGSEEVKDEGVFVEKKKEKKIKTCQETSNRLLLNTKIKIKKKKKKQEE